MARIVAMQAVERVFSILRALAAQEGRGTVGYVADHTGLPKSTVSRLLSALEVEGAVERLDDGGYAIGLGLTSLTQQMDQSTMLRQVAEPYLRELVAEFGEGAGLSVVDGNLSLYVLHVGSGGSVRTEDWTGQAFPSHTVAGGLAMLATWSDMELSRYAKAGLQRLAPNTITKPRDLRQRVARIRADGYAMTVGEFAADINGFGAAITANDGTAFGAINVYGPAFRFPGGRDPDQIGHRLVDAARTIASRLSHL